MPVGITARRVLVALVATAAMVAGGLVAAVPAEAATRTLRVYNATVTEGTGGEGVVAFAVRLSAPAKKKVTFRWRTVSGTASAAAGDFVKVRKGTKASIRKGSTSTVLIVRIKADAVDEYAETFKVHLSHLSAGVKFRDRNAIATIRDDDARPKLSLTTTTVVEGSTAIYQRRPIIASLSRPSGKVITVRYAIRPGSARLNSDLLGKTGVIKFKPGELTAKRRVTLVADSVDEPNETFYVVWSAPHHVRLRSTSAMVVLLDDDGPLTPGILGSTPPSPSPNDQPRLYGLAPANSTVQVFRNGDCTGAPITSGSALTFTGAGILVDMTPNTTNTLTVRATNTIGGADSACSAPFTYVHDDTDPDAPTMLRAVPGSPTQNPAPTVRGDAEAGSTVRVFVDTSCSGTEVDRGSAAEFAASPGLSLGALTPNTPHIVRANATDAAGNVSLCSDPLTVIVDTVAPAAPTGLSVQPAALTNDRTPALQGTAESGSQVQVFVDSACAGSPDATGTAAQFAGAGIAVDSPLSEGDHQLRAWAVDDAGNVGGCSAAEPVSVDLTDPGAPALDAIPDGPDPDPVVTGSAEAGTTVTVYLTDDCSGAAVDTVSAGALGGAGVHLGPGLAAGPYAVTARARDGADNLGPCSTPVTFAVL